MSTTTTDTAPATGAPSPRAVAALLTQAGFSRSDYHRPSVTPAAASTGFRIWRTSSRDNPEARAVAVAHFDAGQHGDHSDDAEAAAAWWAHVRNARHLLGQYAAFIEGGGYDVQKRFGADDPYLVVIARSLPSCRECASSPDAPADHALHSQIGTPR